MLFIQILVEEPSVFPALMKNATQIVSEVLLG